MFVFRFLYLICIAKHSEFVSDSCIRVQKTALSSHGGDEWEIVRLCRGVYSMEPKWDVFDHTSLAISALLNLNSSNEYLICPVGHFDIFLNRLSTTPGYSPQRHTLRSFRQIHPHRIHQFINFTSASQLITNRLPLAFRLRRYCLRLTNSDIRRNYTRQK